ncbi:MAG: MFS transporter [Nocardioidaceae bacterium]
MTATPRGGRVRGSWLTGALPVFTLALCLRPALTAVGPLVPRLREDLGLGEASLGALAAVPLLAFAVVSPFVHRFARRLGAGGTVLLALLALTAATLVRSYAGLSGLWIGTVVLGCAIAFGNVLAPVAVRRTFPVRASAATGLYSAAMGGAAGLASLVAVPLADAAGWRFALGVWALLFGVAAVLWLPVARLAERVPPVTLTADPLAGTVWRLRTGWLITAFFGTQAAIFHSMVTWLPAVLVARGHTEQYGGVQLFVYQGAGILAGLLVPLTMRRSGGQVRATLCAATPIAVGVLGLVLVPGITTLWVFLVGAGSGATLVVSLALAGQAGADHHVVTQLVGMMQSVGYLAAAVTPVVMGLVVEWTGTWTPALLILVGLALAMTAVALPTGRIPGASDQAHRIPLPATGPL